MNANRIDVPDLLLERLLAGDLTPERAAEVRARVAASPSAQARLDALRRENAEILLQHPPRLVAPQILARAGLRPRRSAMKTLAFAMPVVAAAAVVALVVRPSDTDFVNDVQLEKDDHIATRGTFSKLPEQVDHTPTQTPQLHVYRRTGTLVQELAPGAAARAGDTLQLSYSSLGSTFGVVLSIDGRGGVTLHYPEAQGQAQKLLPAGEVSLAHAYELDDAPEFERFFIVGSDAPLDVEALLAQARALAQDRDRAVRSYLELPQSARQNSFTLKKEAR